jgi:DNA processing protein
MNKIEDWLRLWHIPGIGPRTYNFLLSKFPTPTKILQASYVDLVSQGVSARIAQAIIENNSSAYKTDLHWLQTNIQHHIVVISQPEYPPASKINI